MCDPLAECHTGLVYSIQTVTVYIVWTLLSIQYRLQSMGMVEYTVHSMCMVEYTVKSMGMVEYSVHSMGMVDPVAEPVRMFSS